MCSLLQRRRSGPFLALLMATTAVVSPFAVPATASWAAGDVTLNIPASELDSVLTQIARVGSQPISFPAALTRGRRAGPIVGHMSVPEALARALAGTGLVAVPGPGGALMIRAGAPVGGGAPKAGDIAAIDVTDAPGGDAGFAAGKTQSSSRLDIPLRENPRSITGVTDEVIRAQAQTSVYDAARNVSNVRIEEGGDQPLSRTSYTIRGFNQSEFLVGGMSAGPLSVNIPIADVERIDVIKGPTTELTGQTLSGGAINVITKEPTSEPIRRMDLFFGSRFYRTLAFDFGGPISGLEGVTYRLNVSGNTANYAFGGDNSPHEGLISPVVRWQGTDTKVTVGIRFIDSLAGYSPVTVGDFDTNLRPIRVPRESGFGNINSFQSGRSFNPYSDIEHRIGAYDAGELGLFDFKLRNRTAFYLTDNAGAGFVPAGVVDKINGVPIVTPIGNRQEGIEQRLNTQTDLQIQQTAEYFKNTMRFGFDYRSSDSNVKGNPYYNDVKFSLLDPLRNLPFPGYTTKSWFGSNFAFRTRTSGEQTGISFQDKIDLVERLHILGSVRNDWYEQQSFGTSRTNMDQSALTYNAGAVYDVLPWASVYGSVGTGFQAQTALINRTEPAPPINSETSEYGFKLSLLEGQLTVTGARFSNVFSNNILFDPRVQANILGPGYRSEGYDLDFQGQITPDLQVIGGYSNTNFVNKPDIQAKPGTPVNVVPGQPTQQANLFAVYTFPDGVLRGLSIGGGARGQTFSYSDYAPKSQAPKIPGFVTFDAVMGYKMENVRFDLSVRNIFDRYYYNTASIPFYIPVGQGRIFMVRSTIDF
jgi:iron complex outermembrane receptor protein